MVPGERVIHHGVIGMTSNHPPVMKSIEMVPVPDPSNRVVPDSPMTSVPLPNCQLAGRPSMWIWFATSSAIAARAAEPVPSESNCIVGVLEEKVAVIVETISTLVEAGETDWAAIP